MAINFRTQIVLIVDDMPNMRVAIKGMLQYVGVERIDTAANGEDAIASMRNNRYDIIICDYNLGDGKNGQQVLEEAKHNKLIGYSTIFIMLTAENTMSMVMGAVEYRPDDYLTKPINKEILKPRLVNAIEKKSDLEAIDRMVKAGAYENALKLCNHHIAAKPKHLSDLLRMKAEIAVHFGDLATAQDVYQGVISRRRLPWAMTGMAGIHFQRKEYDEAIPLLQEVISEDPAFMEAYDLLAKCHRATNNAAAAQECLLQAVEVSPVSIQRQMSLGELALETGDNSVAEKAYRSAISIGRHSIYKNPTNYTRLAQTLASNGGGKEALRVLKSMRSDYPGDRVIALQSTISESQVYDAIELESAARNARASAAKLYSEIGPEVPAEISMDLATMQLQAGEHDAAMSVLSTLARNHYEDNEVIDQIKSVISSSGMAQETHGLIEQARQEVRDLNNRAVKLFRDGDFTGAMETFRTLSEMAQSNLTVNMNSVRIHLEAAKKEVDRERSLEYARLSLGRIAEMKKRDEEKYRHLLQEYMALTQQARG